MQAMVDTFDDTGLEAETAGLNDFYASVRVRAAEVTSAEGKQKVIAELYERFFKVGFKKQSEALGIVYTPVSNGTGLGVGPTQTPITNPSLVRD